MPINCHCGSDMKKRFRYPLLVEAEGDLSHLEAEFVEIVEVYECIHTGREYTVMHVPHGTMPCAVTAAAPIQYGVTDD